MRSERNSLVCLILSASGMHIQWPCADKKPCGLKEIYPEEDIGGR